MKKMNERGWGLGIMLVFICVFVMAIIIIAVQASKLGIAGSHNLDIPIPTKTPLTSPTAKPVSTPTVSQSPKSSISELEEGVAVAAESYRIKYYSSLQKGDNVTVTVKKLMSEEILASLIYDNNQSCSGYVVIKVGGNQSYLKCGSQKTKGYLAEFDS